MPFDIPPLLLFLGSLAILLVGGELVVRGAVQLATALGLPALVIGLTVVALGTGSPELAVALTGVIKESPAISIGTIVGSNLVNILLVLGSSALVAPLFVSRRIVKLDVPVMIAASVGLYAVSWDGEISRLDGLILAGSGLIYFTLLIISGRAEVRSEGTTDVKPDSSPAPCRRDEAGVVKSPIWLAFLTLVIGLAGLLLGATGLVDAATQLATAFGISEAILAVTMIALGTSLPELVVSIMASLRNQRDLAVGNVVGSNIVNILVVIGITGSISSTAMPVSDGLLAFDMPLMLAVAVACLPIVFTGQKIARWEGGLFLLYYVAFGVFLFLKATDHDALGRLSWVMVAFVAPITVVTLILTATQALFRGELQTLQDSTEDSASSEMTESSSPSGL